MNITLQLDAEVERRLQEAAALNDLTVEAYIQRLVEQSVGVIPKANTMPREQWVAEFRAWIASHTPLPHEADDSRESIYAGRGE
jgi:predicted transcriptional regulator